MEPAEPFLVLPLEPYGGSGQGGAGSCPTARPRAGGAVQRPAPPPFPWDRVPPPSRSSPPLPARPSAGHPGSPPGAESEPLSGRCASPPRRQSPFLPSHPRRHPDCLRSPQPSPSRPPPSRLLFLFFPPFSIPSPAWEDLAPSPAPSSVAAGAERRAARRGAGSLRPGAVSAFPSDRPAGCQV